MSELITAQLFVIVNISLLKYLAEKNSNGKIVASFCYKWSVYRTFPTIFWISSAESWPWKSVVGLWRTIQRQTPVLTVWQPAQCHWSRWSCPGKEENADCTFRPWHSSSAPQGSQYCNASHLVEVVDLKRVVQLCLSWGALAQGGEEEEELVEAFQCNVYQSDVSINFQNCPSLSSV